MMEYHSIYQNTEITNHLFLYITIYSLQNRVSPKRKTKGQADS
jgi:hypothetical protein